jgi:hypothetical protein
MSFGQTVNILFQLSSFDMSKVSLQRPSLRDRQNTHPTIDNPFGFPLPLPGTVILEEEVVKEGHLIKSLKRRLFTLVIDPDNFPCLIYTCVSLCGTSCHSTLLYCMISLSLSFFLLVSDPISKKGQDIADDSSQEKGHIRLVRVVQLYYFLAAFFPHRGFFSFSSSDD